MTHPERVIDASTGVTKLDPALDSGHATWVAVATRQGLLSAAQWNVVEFHTENALAGSFKTPNRLVFDLDPGEGVAWQQVQEAAQLVHALLDQVGHEDAGGRTMSPRVIWTGAISFGLVHVPVALCPVSQDSGIDFDWLGRRSMDPVGCQRINSRSSPSCRRPKSLFAAGKPYCLEPIGKGEKVYALLREAMAQAGVIGISRVVMHTKEHLAALITMGPALVLNTIRWANEIRPVGDLKLPAAGKETGPARHPSGGTPRRCA